MCLCSSRQSEDLPCSRTGISIHSLCCFKILPMHSSAWVYFLFTSRFVRHSFTAFLTLPYIVTPLIVICCLPLFVLLYFSSAPASNRASSSLFPGSSLALRAVTLASASSYAASAFALIKLVSMTYVMETMSLLGINRS